MIMFARSGGGGKAYQELMTLPIKDRHHKQVNNNFPLANGPVKVLLPPFPRFLDALHFLCQACPMQCVNSSPAIFIFQRTHHPPYLDIHIIICS